MTHPILELLRELKLEIQKLNYPIKIKDYKNEINKTVVNKWLNLLDTKNNKYHEYLYNRLINLNYWQGDNHYLSVTYLFYPKLNRKTIIELLQDKTIDFPYEMTDEEKNEYTVSYETYFNIYNQLYRKCRGVIIDLEDMELVSLPMDKFFMEGQIKETIPEVIKEKLENAKNIEITDKMDGSFIQVTQYKNDLIVSGNKCNNSFISPKIRYVKEMIISRKNYHKAIKENEDLTFMFEFISDELEPHVVRYGFKEPRLFLIAIRDKRTGEDYSYLKLQSIAKKYNLIITDYLNTNLEEIEHFKKTVNYQDAEGVIIRIDGERIKIKYESYLNNRIRFERKYSKNLLIKSYYEDTLDELISNKSEDVKKIIYKDLQDLQDKIDFMEKIINKTINYLDNKYPITENSEGKSNFHKIMIWISENTTKETDNVIRSHYLNQKYDILKYKGGVITETLLNIKFK